MDEPVATAGVGWPTRRVVDRLAARRTELMQQGQDVLDTARADGRDDVKATEAAIVDDVLAQLRVLGEAPCWNSPDALRSVDGARVATRCPAVIVQERAGGELRAVYAAELHNGGWIPRRPGGARYGYVLRDR